MIAFVYLGFVVYVLACLLGIVAVRAKLCIVVHASLRSFVSVFVRCRVCLTACICLALHALLCMPICFVFVCVRLSSFDV